MQLQFNAKYKYLAIKKPDIPILGSHTPYDNLVVIKTYYFFFYKL